MAELKEIYLQTKLKLDEFKHPKSDLSDVAKASSESVVQIAQPDVQLNEFAQLEELVSVELNEIQSSFSIELKKQSIADILVELRSEIQTIRKIEFDSETTSGDRNVRIKYHREGFEIDGNPIAEHEGHIQALRYLQGMLLILQNCQNLPQASQAKFSEDIKAAFERYEVQLSTKTYDHAAFALAEEFAGLLHTHLNISKSAAQKQVTMARDLGVMLEDHPDVCTITETAEHVTVEYSRNLKISERFYQEEIAKRNERVWYSDAKSYAGLSGPNTWLDSFFENSYADLMQRGVAAPPSARWLPMPSNCQFVKTQVLNRDNVEIGTQSSFVRLGTVAPFEVNSIREQERLAEVTLREVIENHIQEQIDAYTKFYGKGLAGEKPTFFVNYQTLLTPHFLETYLYPLKNVIPLFKDNNGRFVDMAKKAMANIAGDIKKEYAEKGVSLHFHQTNASVNVRADWFTARNSNSDHAIRKAKLRATADLLIRLAGRELNSISPELIEIFSETEATTVKDMMASPATCLNEIAAYINGKAGLTVDLAIKMELLAQTLEKGQLLAETDILLENEIALRMRSSFQLRSLINGSPAYDRLDAYQRNLQMVALETHALGRQAMTIAGCKSARDRTAVFAGALRTMQENVKAMYNWATTYKGIMSSLVQGHHVRSMNWHVTVVKASMVAKAFVNGVSEAFKHSIAAISFFSKKLGSLTSSVKKKLDQPNSPKIIEVRDAPETIEVRVKKSSTGSLHASMENVLSPLLPVRATEMNNVLAQSSPSMYGSRSDELPITTANVETLKQFGTYATQRATTPSVEAQPIDVSKPTKK